MGIGNKNLVDLAKENYSNLKLPKSDLNFDFIKHINEDHNKNLSYRGLLIHINYILNDILNEKDVKINLEKLKVLDQIFTKSQAHKTKDDSPFFDSIEPPVNIYPVPKEFLIQLGDQYAPNFKLFLSIIIKSLSAFIDTKHHENMYKREIMFGINFIKSILFPNDAVEKGSKFFDNVQEEDLLKLWGNTEKGFARFIIPMLNPYIKISKVLSIPYKDTFIQIRIITNNLESNNVMLNFHGGGYIAMTSLSHEMYLRTWANELDMTIVCVDYSLAPKYPYPFAIEEGLFIYDLLLKGEILKNINIKNLIFSGDSAGGGILFAMMNRLITNGSKRLPDAIVAVYPSTNLAENPSPSRMLSMVDPLLNFKVLKILNRAYVPAHINQYDFNVSPCFAPDDHFRAYPKTLISVASLDPLFDDSYYMAKRIGYNCQLNIYDGMSHGYMHLISFEKTAKKANQDIIEWIRKILMQ